MPKGIKGSGKPRENKTISGEHVVFEHKESKEPFELVAYSTKPIIRDILLSIVDAIYDKDGDAATWKPIRDKIEAL